MTDSEIRAASENNKKAHFVVFKNKVAFPLCFDKESIWKINVSFV